MRSNLPIAVLLAIVIALHVGCGGVPDLDDPAVLRQVVASAPEFERLQQRGSEEATLYHAPNETQPYTGWAKEMYSSFLGTRDQVARLRLFDNGRQVFDVQWYENGQKSSEEHYQNGEATGLHTSWFENGQTSWERYYERGELTGSDTGWFENGQKAWERYYERGDRTGLHTTWHNNGQKGSEGNYERGEPNGLLAEWHDNGQKRWEGRFDLGEPVGLHTAWYDNGQKRSERSYEDGLPAGVHVMWYGSGQRLAEERYESGRLTGLDTWLENGTEIEVRRIDMPSTREERTREDNTDLFFVELDAAFCGEVTVRTRPHHFMLASTHRVFTGTQSVSGERSRGSSVAESDVLECGRSVLYVEVTHTYRGVARRGEAVPAGVRYSISVLDE